MAELSIGDGAEKCRGIGIGTAVTVEVPIIFGLGIGTILGFVISTGIECFNAKNISLQKSKL